MEQILTGFFSNLGFFAPAAALGWWIIKTQRTDLISERDTARADLAAADKRVEELTDRVIVLAQSVEKTMAQFVAAINEGKR